LYTALLGGDIEINTLHGKLKLKVKPVTQNNTKIRLKEKGFPVYKEEGLFGDLYVTYLVKLPTNISERERELFLQLQQMANT
jgi:curved DNA-binding protein